MSGLLLAVVVASVMGSMHCVGMCGPLALWASGAGRDGHTRGTWARLTSYHAGRLITYMTAGGIAGAIGAAISLGGSMVGVQSLAARVVGGAMIALGLVRTVEWLAPSMMKKSATEPVKPGGSSIAGWVARRRAWIGSLPMVPRGIAAGALTTLLPCGWLYLFVLVAAGTGHPLLAMTVMFAFWLGTLPALTALVAGTFRLAPRFGRVVPLLGAVLLLTTGLYTATGRAAADLSPLTRRAAAVNHYFASRDTDGDRSSVARELLDTLSGEPLPCCADGD